MADACSNELHQREQNVLWASQVERRTAGHVYGEEEIDTVEGPVHRLLSVDGREPSPSDRTQDDDRLRDLRENPSARLTLKKNREAEEKKLDDLLHAIPDVFLFKDQGKQGHLERLAFSPNPAYKTRDLPGGGPSRAEWCSSNRSYGETGCPIFRDSNAASEFCSQATGSPKQGRHDRSEPGPALSRPMGNKLIQD
jgi:hypothetical protein